MYRLARRRLIAEEARNRARHAALRPVLSCSGVSADGEMVKIYQAAVRFGGASDALMSRVSGVHITTIR